jgi:class 3 adenylate cyclase
LQLDAKPLGTILQTEALPNAKLGLHPDFTHLKESGETEFHYIVSVFIDIQGSTNLHKEHDLEEIYTITNTIQSAAIQTCLIVGGHIQRLQGDGVFAYFGGKNIPKKKAVEMAVTACSMFSYFVKNDLKNIFLSEGIEDINTRIGIDFGDDDDVLWSNFGLLNVSELTTLSLHTSLASKMQAYADTNGIVVGQHVKNLLGIDEDFYDLVRNSKGEVVKRYIFENNKTNFRYTQYTFKWLKYVKTLPFVHSDADGNLYISDLEEERIKRLKNTSSLIATGNAFLDRQGNITSNATGVKHEPHRFHYGK